MYGTDLTQHVACMGPNFKGMIRTYTPMAHTPPLEINKVNKLQKQVLCSKTMGRKVSVLFILKVMEDRRKTGR